MRKVEEETHRQLGGAVTRPLLTAAHREYVAQSKCVTSQGSGEDRE